MMALLASGTTDTYLKIFIAVEISVRVRYVSVYRRQGRCLHWCCVATRRQGRCSGSIIHCMRISCGIHARLVRGLFINNATPEGKEGGEREIPRL